MAKVFIFLANGYEEIEGLTVVDLLRRANINITMVSITGDRNVTGSHGITSVADTLFEETDFSEADMLVLPGGMPGTTNLLKHPGLDQLLRSYAGKGKQLAAICAAPRVLGEKGLLSGKNVTCYPGNENALTGAHVIQAAVVSDGNVTTSRGLGTAIDFSLSLIKNLKDAKEAHRIAEAIQYPHFNDDTFF